MVVEHKDLKSYNLTSVCLTNGKCEAWPAEQWPSQSQVRTQVPAFACDLVKSSLLGRNLSKPEVLNAPLEAMIIQARFPVPSW